ncbi:MAG: hypothetical protein QOF57_2110 [Frankiaceae bacterium]|nr:hypothetical protein [Frankiaceae bacterium]
MTNALYGALLAAATVGPTAARLPSPASSWVWPVQPPVVTRGFDPPPTPYAAGHRGIDLAAVAGQPVEAAGAGVVSFAGQVGGIGVVVIRHAGLRTTYEPVAPAVTAGQQVAAGATIGHVTGGHLGCTVCLHFGLRSGADYLDPMTLFARGPVRLLPVDGPLPGLATGATGAAAATGATAAPGATAAAAPRHAHLALVAGTAETGAAAAAVGLGLAAARGVKRRRAPT